MPLTIAIKWSRAEKMKRANKEMASAEPKRFPLDQKN
jgi:hypothetical protein